MYKALNFHSFRVTFFAAAERSVYIPSSGCDWFGFGRRVEVRKAACARAFKYEASAGGWRMRDVRVGVARRDSMSDAGAFLLDFKME